MVVTDKSISLVPWFGEPVEFRREDVRQITVERYRGPFVFRTLFWILGAKRHPHAFVPFRSRHLIETLRYAGWPVSERS